MDAVQSARALRRRELETVWRLAWQAAVSVDVGEFAGVCVAGIQDVVPADIVTYNEIDAARGIQHVVAHPDTWVTPALMQQFSKHVQDHPLVNHYRDSGDGRALKISDFLTLERFHELDLYREFFGPIGVEHQIAITLPAPRPLVIGIALNRGEDDFTEHERTRLNILRPLLAHAHSRVREREGLATHVSALEAGADALSDGLVILEDSGQVRYASAAARSLVESVLRVSLRTRLPRELRDTEGVVERSGRRLYVRRVGGDAGVLVLSAAPTREALGLTPRELEIIASVADGLTDREIAAALHISPATVKKHIEHVFEKLDVRTRAAAVGRVFGGSPTRA